MAVITAVDAQTNANPRKSGKSFFSYNNARVSLRQRQQTVVPKVVKKHTVKNNVTSKRSKVMEPDTVAYYMRCIKQNGWMRGVGEPISLEQARHLYGYLKFSKKNKAGHWTKMENFNSYGELVNTYAMGTYLVNPFLSSDKQQDADWSEKLRSTVSYEFIGDRTGEKCVQENAYDKYGNLVYSFIPVEVGENRVLGHYVDAWGMPALLRGNDGAKYVVIQRDKDGYETKITYIGSNGYPAKNMWGSYIEKKTYKDGIQTSNMSCNVDGSFILDTSGNSGWRSISNKYGNSLVTFNYDDNDKIMRLTRVSDGGDWIGQRTQYDSWGREKKCEYITADGKPDTTSFGVHGYEVKYNDHGQSVGFRYFGIDGKLHNNGDGIAMITREYDKNGNQIFFKLVNSKGLLVNNSDGECMSEARYDDEGNCTIEKDYYSNFGTDTVLTFSFYNDSTRTVRKYPQQNEIGTYIYDEKGREVEHSFTDLSGSPTYSRNYGYCKEKTSYTSKPGISIKKICYLDTIGNYMSYEDSLFVKYIGSIHYNNYIEEVDSLNKIQTIKKYDGLKLLAVYRQPLKEDLSIAEGQYGFDVMGAPARTHYTDNLYYKAFTGATVKGKYAYVGILNEYGDASYAKTHDSDYPYVFAYRLFNGFIDLDENGKKIHSDDLNSFRDSLPRAYIIEVYDSVKSKKWGIQSGDVIMTYGTWQYPTLSNKFERESDLIRDMFQQRLKDKTMVVMRRNPANNAAEYLPINLGTGLPKDFGFYFFRVYCTKKEADRYNATYQVYANSVSRTLSKNPEKMKNKVRFIIPFRVNAGKMYAFTHGLTDDAILLGMVLRGDSNKFLRLTRETILDSVPNVDGYETQRFWYTTDLKNIESMDTKGAKSLDARTITTFVDKSISAPVDKLYKLCEKEMDGYVAQEMLNLKEVNASKHYSENADSVNLVLVQVADSNGYLCNRGLDANFYIVLSWNGWKCSNTLDEFEKEFLRTRPAGKDVVLLPYYKDDNRFGDIKRYVTPSGVMAGLYISDLTVTKTFFLKYIFPRYMWWQNHQ